MRTVRVNFVLFRFRHPLYGVEGPHLWPASTEGEYGEKESLPDHWWRGGGVFFRKSLEHQSYKDDVETVGFFLRTNFVSCICRLHVVETNHNRFDTNPGDLSPGFVSFKNSGVREAAKQNPFFYLLFFKHLQN